MIGQLVAGRYEIVSALGEGGIGQTFIAKDTQLPNCPHCVVKRLKLEKQEPAYVATVQRLFQSEAEVLQKLGHHDQIPRLLAYPQEAGVFYLVEDFIEGTLIKDELRPNHFWDEPQVIDFLVQMLTALDFLHLQNPKVIHRDIKPANIIRRSHDQTLVLIDFGAVKEIPVQASTVMGGGIESTIAIGTPGYMPLEQLEGKPRPCSDLYAIGMIAIQALTGLRPHHVAEDELGEFVWQSKAPISDRTQAVIAGLVRKNWRHRYQDAQAVLKDLEPDALTTTHLKIPQPHVTPNPPQGALNSAEALSSTPQPAVSSGMVNQKKNWLPMIFAGVGGGAMAIAGGAMMTSLFYSQPQAVESNLASRRVDAAPSSELASNSTPSIPEDSSIESSTIKPKIVEKTSASSSINNSIPPLEKEGSVDLNTQKTKTTEKPSTSPSPSTQANEQRTQTQSRPTVDSSRGTESPDVPASNSVPEGISLSSPQQQETVDSSDKPESVIEATPKKVEQKTIKSSPITIESKAVIQSKKRLEKDGLFLASGYLLYNDGDRLDADFRVFCPTSMIRPTNYVHQNAKGETLEQGQWWQESFTPKYDVEQSLLSQVCG